jgi:hypothetical protein
MLHIALFIPILYEDAPNYMRNEPQRGGSALRGFPRQSLMGETPKIALPPRCSDCRRKGHEERKKKSSKFGAAS